MKIIIMTRLNIRSPDVIAFRLKAKRKCHDVPLYKWEKRHLQPIVNLVSDTLRCLVENIKSSPKLVNNLRTVFSEDCVAIIVE